MISLFFGVTSITRRREGDFREVHHLQTKMPAVQQKTDLTSKKKRLEEMREREKQLAQELDLHMKKPLQQKSPVVKSKTGSSTGKITPRSKPTISSATTETTATTKSTVKKKIDSKSTTPRRKKSKDKTIKQADSPKVPATDNLLFLEQTEITREEIENLSNGASTLNFEETYHNNDSPSHSGNLSDTNPFSTNGSGGGLIDFDDESQPNEYHHDLDFFGGGGAEHNPFNAPLGGDMQMGGIGDSRIPSNGLLNLQDDIIFEEEEQQREEKPKKTKMKTKSTTKTKTEKATKTAATAAAPIEETEEFYFPEDDNFPEDDRAFANGGDRGMYSDDFPENESDSELYQEQERKRQKFQENREEQEETFEDDEYQEDKGLRQQELIRREIQSDYLREEEVKRINLLGPSGDEAEDRNDNFMSDDIRSKGDREKQNSHRKSIQSLNEYYNDTEEESDDGNDYSKQISTAERIQLELLEQNQKERELKEIHRSLSRENIFYYDSAYEETEDEALDDEEERAQNTGDESEHEERDTRSMILNEMEALREREKELKKRRSYHEGIAYDSNEEFETENDYEAEHHRDGESRSAEEEESKVSVMDKIMSEMHELETREKELKKNRHLYPPTVSAAKQKERSPNTSLESVERPGQLTKKPIFGSRDDLVAYFGTNQEEAEKEEKQAKKTTPRRDKTNAVKIPKVFKKMEAAAAAVVNKTKSSSSRGPKTTNHSAKSPASKLQNSREKQAQQVRYETEMQEHQRHQIQQQQQEVERKKHPTRSMVNGFDHPSNTAQQNRKSQILLKKQLKQESLLAQDRVDVAPKQHHHQRTQAKVSFGVEGVCMRILPKILKKKIRKRYRCVSM